MVAVMAEKQGLESFAIVVTHLHTEVNHFFNAGLSGKRRKTA